MKGPLESIINADSIGSDKEHIQGTNDAEVKCNSTLCRVRFVCPYRLYYNAGPYIYISLIQDTLNTTDDTHLTSSWIWSIIMHGIEKSPSKTCLATVNMLDVPRTSSASLK